MDCASFEHELAELLGESLEAVDRRVRLSSLRAHAAECRECAGSRDLLELLAGPPGERDLAEEPGRAYWDGFDERLGERIRREEAGGARGARWWLAAAAALLLVALGGWLLRGASESAPSPIARAEPDPPALAKPIPDPLADTLSRASPVELDAELDALVGWGASWDSAHDLGSQDWVEDGEGPLFPDAADLDPQARRELLQWLRDQAEQVRS